VIERCSLELDGVTVRAGARTLVDRVNLRLEPSDLVAIVGPNGAGKSTLLRVAAGLIAPSSGEVRVDGRPLSSFPPRLRAGRIAWLPQRPEVTEPIEAVDLVSTGRFRFRESAGRTREAALAALARLGVIELARRTVNSLSGGELQRVMLATVVAQDSPLILLDEPSAALDPLQQIELYAFIGELRRGGIGVLCVTHDVNLLGFAVRRDEAARLRVVGLQAGAERFAVPYDAPDLANRLADLFDVELSEWRAGERRVLLPSGRRGDRAR
jgi:iron complex transport system ATP-binding protein